MRGWTAKDERQYEHIKDSELDQGADQERAAEIAARTVNKHRRIEGRTPNRRTQGTGNPNHQLSEHSVDELRNQAKQLGIRGRARMRKAELVEAIQAKR